MHGISLNDVWFTFKRMFLHRSNNASSVIFENVVLTYILRNTRTKRIVGMQTIALNLTANDSAEPTSGHSLQNIAFDVVLLLFPPF